MLYKCIPFTIYLLLPPSPLCTLRNISAEGLKRGIKEGWFAGLIRRFMCNQSTGLTWAGSTRNEGCPDIAIDSRGKDVTPCAVKQRKVALVSGAYSRVKPAFAGSPPPPRGNHRAAVFGFVFGRVKPCKSRWPNGSQSPSCCRRRRGFQNVTCREEIRFS